MPSAWITHVKKYAAENNVSYKEALSKASASYKKGSGASCSSCNDPRFTQAIVAGIDAAQAQEQKAAQEAAQRRAQRRAEQRRAAEEAREAIRQQEAIDRMLPGRVNMNGRGCCESKNIRVAPYKVEDEGESPFSPRQRNIIIVKPLEKPVKVEPKKKKKNKNIKR